MIYAPKFIDGKTANELTMEMELMYHREYAYGWTIDRPRLWDIIYTLRVLRGKTEEKESLEDNAKQ